MLCPTPIYLDGDPPTPVPCGQCMNCRINNRRKWTARILLEALDTEQRLGEVSWCTLTYSDENIPQVSRGGGPTDDSLDPRDLQLCFKRLRKLIGPFRFFAVGEYGDKTFRPHYHAMLFGPPVTEVEAGLGKEWADKLGQIMVRPWRMNEKVGSQNFQTGVNRASYVAHYTTKKMMAPDDPRLGPNRRQEFSRMSLRPGIGCVQHLLDLHTTKAGARNLVETGDVGSQVRIDGRLYPLDRTVRNWMREQMGIPLDQKERTALTGVLPPEYTVSSDELLAVFAQMEKLERRATRRHL